MTQPESTASVITRICRALSRADGFTLYFVLVNLPAARQALSLQVQKQLQRPVVSLHVPPEGVGETTLDGWLLPQLHDAPPDSAVFLHGLEHALPTGRVPLRRFLQQLNWRRAALKQLARPVVIWLPRHALDSMAEHAPDLYDWYSNVYEFASSKEEEEQLYSRFYIELNTGVHPAYRLSKKEKDQWLHTLTALLDEHPQHNAYRASLLKEAGRVHHASGNLEDAQELYQQALAIYQEIGSREGESATLNNLAISVYAKGDYATALMYLEQSLAIDRELGDKKGEGVTLSNISQIYKAQGNYASAMTYLEQSLAIRQEIGDKAGKGVTLNNISQIYDALGDYASAMTYLEQSLAIRQEIGDKAGEAVTSWNIGLTYEEQGDLKQAEAYTSRAVQLAEELGHPDLENYREGLEQVRTKLWGR